MLTLDPELKKVVETCWKTKIQGYKMFILSQKLKILKKPIRRLMKSKGDLSKKVDQCRSNLDVAQADLERSF